VAPKDAFVNKHFGKLLDAIMAKSHQLIYLISPLLLGLLLAIAPILINLFILLTFLVFEAVFIKKHGFAPFKYIDQIVEPSSFEFSNHGYKSYLKGPTIKMNFPSIYSENDINLAGRSKSLKSFIKDIETQTGLTHKIYYCATGANILFGAHPILGIQFEETAPMFNNESCF